MRICARPACGNPLPDNRAGRKYCSDECRNLQHNARSTRPPEPRPCERCGTMIEKPYKGDQKYCQGECAYEVHLERVSKPREATERDEQMDKLFRYYKAKTNIRIDSRPDGTRLLCLSDTQFPFVDEAFLDAIYNFVQDWKPNDIILNGDLLDCFELSDFDKRPERMFNLETEFEMARDMLVKLKRYAAKDCRIGSGSV